jgi:hypothetical protein
LKKITGGTPGAASTITPGADLAIEIESLMKTIRGK